MLGGALRSCEALRAMAVWETWRDLPLFMSGQKVGWASVQRLVIYQTTAPRGRSEIQIPRSPYQPITAFCRTLNSRPSPPPSSGALLPYPEGYDPRHRHTARSGWRSGWLRWLTIRRPSHVNACRLRRERHPPHLDSYPKMSTPHQHSPGLVFSPPLPAAFACVSALSSGRKRYGLHLIIGETTLYWHGYVRDQRSCHLPFHFR